MATTSRRGQSFWGTVLIGIGLGLLLVRQGLLAPTIGDLLPFAVAIIGLWMLLGALRDPRGRGMVAGVVATIGGLFFLAVGFGWVQQEAFLAVLLVSLGLGLLLRSWRARED